MFGIRPKNVSEKWSPLDTQRDKCAPLVREYAHLSVFFLNFFLIMPHQKVPQI